jgi:hypothetical protein
LDTPILFYGLQSIDEAVFVEKALAEFRLKLRDSVVEPPLVSSMIGKEDWEKMTLAEKLACIDHLWTPDKLRDIKPWILEVDTVLAVMDLCAQSPKTWVLFKTACGFAGMEHSQGRGQMQALTKKTSNQMGISAWPVVVNKTPPGGGGLGYMMSDTIAHRWREIRKEQ